MNNQNPSTSFPPKARLARGGRIKAFAPIAIILIIVGVLVVAGGAYYFLLFTSCQNGEYVCGQIIVNFNNNFKKSDALVFFQKLDLQLDSANYFMDESPSAFFSVKEQDSLEFILSELNKEPEVKKCYENPGIRPAVCDFKNDITENEIKKILDKYQLLYNDDDIYIWDYYVVKVKPGTEKQWIEDLKEYSEVESATLNYISYPTSQ